MKLNKKMIATTLIFMLVMSIVLFTGTNVNAMVANEKISTVNVNVSLPAVGTVIVDETTKPTITLGDTKYAVTWTMFIDGNPEELATYDEGAIFGTTIEEGGEYWAEVYLAPIEGYEFDCGVDYENPENNYNNVNLTVNGGKDYIPGGFNSENQLAFFVKLKAATATTETEEAEEASVGYTVLEGENQTVTKKDDLQFRFSVEYAKFLASGKVFVDGNLTDSKNYDSWEGSTVIKFKDDFVKSLSVGKHTVKVTVDDGEVETEFTIKKASNNPETGDNIALYAGIFAVAMLGSAIVIKKRK